jgi:hypothetical protein
VAAEVKRELFGFLAIGDNAYGEGSAARYYSYNRGAWHIIALNSTSYAWKFVPEAGKSFTDSGTYSCH